MRNGPEAMTHPYATAAFARGLPHVGEPVAVPEWDAHVLARPIAETAQRDAAGTYPVTVIAPDADVAGGLARLRDAGLVSLVMVIEDHLRPSLEALGAALDFVTPFKSHHVYDRSLGAIAYAGQHRTKLKRALKKVEVREIRLTDHLADWQALYGHLTGRHGLAGLHAFPAVHHETLAALPGVRTFGAFLQGRLVSAHVFVTHRGHALSHLTASSPEGYAVGAAYAVNDLAISAMADCELVNFGGGAGMGDDPDDGLVQFKRGFANATRPSYLAGAVLDPPAYGALSEGVETGFFPAYRALRRDLRKA